MVAELLHQLVAAEEVRSPQPAEAGAAAQSLPQEREAAVRLRLLVAVVEVGVQLHQQVEAAALFPLLEAAAALLHPLPVVEVEATRLPPREAEVLLLLRPPQEAAVAEAVAALPPHRLPVHLLSASRERVRQTARLQARAAS